MLWKSFLFPPKHCCVWVTVSQSVTFVCAFICIAWLWVWERDEKNKSEKDCIRVRKTKRETKTRWITDNDGCSCIVAHCPPLLSISSWKAENICFLLLINKYIALYFFSSHRHKQNNSETRDEEEHRALFPMYGIMCPSFQGNWPASAVFTTQRWGEIEYT